MMRHRKHNLLDRDDGPDLHRVDTESSLSDLEALSPPQSNRFPESLILIGLVVFRMINAIMVKSHFDPDEYWQVLEPARVLAYGQGWLTWEWVPTVALRSWLHPILFSTPWFVLKALKLDAFLTPELFGLAPRILIQAPLLALADFATCKLAESVGARFSRGLFLTLTNWFVFYCGIRTYSNSFEGCLLTIALWRWPLNAVEASKMDIAVPLFLAATSVIVRASSIVAWIYLGFCYAVFDIGLSSKELWMTVFTRVVPIGLGVLISSLILDRYFYGKFVFIPYNFVDFNIIRGISEFYGTYGFHWYVLECFPAILGIQLPLFGMGIKYCWEEKTSPFRTARMRLLGLIAVVLAVLSSSAHKEMRFAFPILPISIAIAALGLDRWLALPQLSIGGVKFTQGTVRKATAFVVVVAGAIPALYLSLVFQRGPIDVILWVSTHGQGKVDFLMPCHSAPLYAFTHPVHSKVTSYDILDCSPHVKELGDIAHKNSSFAHEGVEESRYFEEHIVEFTVSRYNEGIMPNMIVVKDTQLEEVNSALAQISETRGESAKEYASCARFKHTLWPSVGWDFVVLCEDTTK